MNTMNNKEMPAGNLRFDEMAFALRVNYYGDKKHTADSFGSPLRQATGRYD